MFYRCDLCGCYLDERSKDYCDSCQKKTHDNRSKRNQTADYEEVIDYEYIA